MDDFIHTFIFSSGNWAGEGKILLNMVEEELVFNTNWGVQARDFSGKIECQQDIQVQGLSENMRNALSFYDFQSNSFKVDMENQNVGRIIGTGVYDDKMIGWEFRNNGMNFEGFETYRLQEDGSYLMHVEYITLISFAPRSKLAFIQRKCHRHLMKKSRMKERGHETAVNRFFILTACASGPRVLTSESFYDISIGATKEEVIAKAGDPSTITKKDDGTVSIYTLNA
jgi:hypothetical protein